MSSLTKNDSPFTDVSFEVSLEKIRGKLENFNLQNLYFAFLLFYPIHHLVTPWWGLDPHVGNHWSRRSVSKKIIYDNGRKCTYSARREVSCWKVLDSILLIWLCCSPLLRKIHIGINTHNSKCAGKQKQKKLILMHMCMRLCWGLLLTSLEVQSSGKSWADPLSDCKTAPYNNTQCTHTHTHT